MEKKTHVEKFFLQLFVAKVKTRRIENKGRNIIKLLKGLKYKSNLCFGKKFRVEDSLKFLHGVLQFVSKYLKSV